VQNCTDTGRQGENCDDTSFPIYLGEIYDFLVTNGTQLESADPYNQNNEIVGTCSNDCVSGCRKAAGGNFYTLDTENSMKLEISDYGPIVGFIELRTDFVVDWQPSTLDDYYEWDGIADYVVGAGIGTNIELIGWDYVSGPIEYWIFKMNHDFGLGYLGSIIFGESNMSQEGYYLITA
jgi:hypothetical protein